MSYTYRGSSRFDVDGDVVMWNSLIPFLPPEIIGIIASCCDRPTLKALRLTQRACTYAIGPAFNALFEHIHLQGDLKDPPNSSMHRLERIARDKAKSMLVRKITISFRLDWQDAFDPGYLRDQIHVREVDRQIAKITQCCTKCFQKLRNCIEIELQMPSEYGFNPRANIASSLTLGCMLAAAFHAGNSILAIRTSCDHYTLAAPLLLPRHPSAVLQLPHLSSLDLIVGTFTRDFMTSPGPRWSTIFSVISSVRTMALTVRPVRISQCTDAGIDDSVAHFFTYLTTETHRLRELTDLTLKVHVGNLVSLCDFIRNVYPRLKNLSLSIRNTWWPGMAVLPSLFSDIAQSDHLLESFTFGIRPTVLALGVNTAQRSRVSGAKLCFAVFGNEDAASWRSQLRSNASELTEYVSKRQEWPPDWGFRDNGNPE